MCGGVGVRVYSACERVSTCVCVCGRVCAYLCVKNSLQLKTATNSLALSFLNLYLLIPSKNFKCQNL